jgi:hypothetical protein
MIRYFKDGNYVIRAEQYSPNILEEVNKHFNIKLTPVPSTLEAYLKGWGNIKPGDYIIEQIERHHYVKDSKSFELEYNEHEIDYNTYMELYCQLKREEVIIGVKVKKPVGNHCLHIDGDFNTYDRTYCSCLQFNMNQGSQDEGLYNAFNEVNEYLLAEGKESTEMESYYCSILQKDLKEEIIDGYRIPICICNKK